VRRGESLAASCGEIVPVAREHLSKVLTLSKLFLGSAKRQGVVLILLTRIRERAYLQRRSKAAGGRVAGLVGEVEEGVEGCVEKEG
jgi:hypothetical protein